MSVQVTSLISYYEVLQTLSKRHKEVLLAMKKLKCANNLMVSKLLNLPINSKATEIWTHFFGNTDLIAGNAVFTGGVDENGETLGISADAEAFIRLAI
jgi:hypothetical protein